MIDNFTYKYYFSEDDKDTDFLIKNIYLPNTEHAEQMCLLNNDKGDTYLLTKCLAMATTDSVTILTITGSCFSEKQLQNIKNLAKIEDIDKSNKNKYFCIPYYQGKTKLNLYQFPAYKKHNKEKHYEIGLNPEYKKFKALYMANNIFTLRTTYNKFNNEQGLALVSRRLDDIIFTKMTRVKKIWFGLDNIYYYGFREDPLYKGRDLSKMSPNEMLYIYDEEFLKNTKKYDPNFINNEYYHDKVNKCMEPIFVVDKEELKKNFNNKDFKIDNLEDDSNVIDLLFYPKTIYLIST